MYATHTFTYILREPFLSQPALLGQGDPGQHHVEGGVQLGIGALDDDRARGDDAGKCIHQCLAEEHLAERVDFTTEALVDIVNAEVGRVMALHVLASSVRRDILLDVLVVLQHDGCVLAGVAGVDALDDSPVSVGVDGDADRVLLMVHGGIFSWGRKLLF